MYRNDIEVQKLVFEKFCQPDQICKFYDNILGFDSNTIAKLIYKPTMALVSYIAIISQTIRLWVTTDINNINSSQCINHNIDNEYVMTSCMDIF